MTATYTIEEWLRGMVDYDLSDVTLKAKLYNRGVAENTLMQDLSDADGVRKRELLLADVYSWVASTSSVSSGAMESDGGWQHKSASKSVVGRKSLVLAADRIYAKYNEPSPNMGRGKMTISNI